MRYFTGEVVLREEDVAGGGFGFGWGHARVFSNRMRAGFDRGQGWNWNVEHWPYLVPSPHPGSTVALLGRDGREWFRANGDGTFLTLHGARSTLRHDAAAGEFAFAEPDGTLYRFNDFSHPVRPGLFKSVSGPGGLVTEVTDQSRKDIVTVERTHDPGGADVTERYHYEFEDGGPLAGALKAVTLRRRSGAGPWDGVLRAEYAYYGDGESHGLHRDLKTVTRFEDDGGWRKLDVRYYRYWKSDDGPGMEHGLKYVVGPEAYARLEQEAGDPLTAPDGTVSRHADYYFEYADRRVTREVTDGGSRESALSYHENPAYPAPGPDAEKDPNVWFRKTTETRPDDTEVAVYCNAYGQTILRVERDGTDEWVLFNRFNSSGAGRPGGEPVRRRRL